jgi:hypothetical protein
MGMKVNFNNLRKQALYSYHRLATKLNEAKEERIEDGYDDGKIEIDPDDIQKEMDELRSYLFGIACVYREGDEEFKDVSEEAEPIAWFNNEEENDDE